MPAWQHGTYRYHDVICNCWESKYQYSWPHSQVGSLSAAALKHLSSIDRSPGTPYSRPSTPAQRTALQQELTRKLQKMAARMQQLESSNAVENPPSAVLNPESADEEGSPATSSNAVEVPIRASCPGSRPGTASVPLHEMVMQRPSSRGLMASSSWNGPLSSLSKEQQKQIASSSEGGAACSPGMRSPRLSSRMNPMRQSSPAGLGRPMTPLQLQQQRPDTSSGASTERKLRKGLSLTNFNLSRGLLYSVFQVGIDNCCFEFSLSFIHSILFPPEFH